MSKIIVYLLDKFVWMLIITVITTQALQIAGVVDGPAALEQITYEQDPDQEFKVASGDSREKRQIGKPNLLDNIFNIPISTLQSVNDLLQNVFKLRQISAIAKKTSGILGASSGIHAAPPPPPHYGYYKRSNRVAGGAAKVLLST